MGSVVAVDDARVYACSGMDAWLIVSDDGGKTWSQTSSVTQPSMAPANIIVQPSDRDVVVVEAPVLGGAIFRSADAGVTWQRIGNYEHVAVDPVDSNVMYASRVYPLGGIVKSVDRGMTWSDTARVNSFHRGIVVDLKDHETVYAIGIDLPEERTAGLYRTVDGGVTWPSMYPGYTAITKLAIDADDRLYAVVPYEFSKLLLRSTDKAESWSRVTPALPDNADLNITAVAVDPRLTQRLYVATTGQGVIASFDDGVTWEVLGNPPNASVNSVTVTGGGAVLAATPDGIFRYVPTPARRRAVAN